MKEPYKLQYYPIFAELYQMFVDFDPDLPIPAKLIVDRLRIENDTAVAGIESSQQPAEQAEA